MITLAQPWVLLLFPLPLLVAFLAPSYSVWRSALRVPFFNKLSALSSSKPGEGAVVIRKSKIETAALVLIWLSLVLALAKPQRMEEPITRSVPARDLLVAVDLSGSMATEDFKDREGKPISRVEAMKQVMGEFLARREGDRVGLIFFGSAPFVQVPFTDDLEVCRSLLQEAQANLAGPKTMLGDAIGRAIAVFDESDMEEKVLILLADGNDSGSQVPPLEAASLARDRGIQIHTIGMGDPATVGEEKLDTESLEGIAETTDGKSFLAIDSEQLAAVYDELDKLITRKVDTLTDRPVTELFSIPLVVAILLTMLTSGLGLLSGREKTA